MKKICCMLLFFLLCVNFGFGQNERISKLKKALLSQTQDTNKIKINFNLARQYASFSKDSFSIYTNKALDLSLKNDDFKLANIYNYKGVYQLMNSNPDSARFFLAKALKVLDEKEDLGVRATIYQNYARTYEGTGEFEKKINYLIRSVELSKNEPNNQCVSIFNIGAVYAQSNIQDKALVYFKKALNVAEIGKNINIQNASLMAIGNTYLQQKKLDSAKVVLEKSLEICRKTNSTLGYFDTYSALGSLYGKMKLFDKSEEAHIQAKKYAEKLGVESYIMRSIGSLAGHYLSTKNYKKSSSLYEEWEIVYEKNPRMDVGVIAYKDWSEVEGRLGNYDKSHGLLEKHFSIKDSIYSKENRSIIADAETKYQSEKKDKEIAEQQLSLADKELVITKNKSKTRTMSILIVSLLLASILLWFSFRQRQKRMQQQLVAIEREQEVRTLESLMEGEEKERMRIAKELHDGVNVDLSAIKYKLTSLLEKNNEVINEAVNMIDKSCAQVRAISHNLIPPSLKNFSLIETLEDFCTTTNSLHKPEISFNHIGEPIKISKKAEVNIFRIVQELVNNSVKHANASEISVQISHRDNTVQLTVEDNGIGFDKEIITSNGIGLRNVQSRVDYLHARLDFDSNEKGTSYIIDINTDDLI